MVVMHRPMGTVTTSPANYHLHLQSVSPVEDILIPSVTDLKDSDDVYYGNDDSQVLMQYPEMDVIEPDSDCDLLLNAEQEPVAVADLGGVQRFSWNPPFWLSPLYKSYGSRLVLDFMEPSLPSSYKKTLALAYLRVILNEYWSIGKPWARSSTMQRIRSCASFIKVGVANAQMGAALKFSRFLQ